MVLITIYDIKVEQETQILKPILRMEILQILPSLNSEFSCIVQATQSLLKGMDRV